MKYIDEYRDNELVAKLAGRIKSMVHGNLAFMEVCGGHTSSIHRFGIPSLLPSGIRLISGPGCPVCVTDKGFIDKAVYCSRQKEVIIATFGDLIRVPGSDSSLEKERAEGAEIRIVFSGMEALDIAIANPDKKIIFPGIGFETTAPGTAVTLKEAEKKGINNFYVLSAHKIMPPAMEAIIKDGTDINGFICPGHVAAVTGSEIFEFIPEKYRLGCVITGFEPVDIIQAIMMLISQVNNDDPKTEIQYRRAVTRDGNSIAKKLMSEVFETCDVSWRGFGIIRNSGLKLRQEFAKFDAANYFTFDHELPANDGPCICGDILRGRKSPPDCPLFGIGCIPENPVGACMVSGEGACNTWFKYR